MMHRSPLGHVLLWGGFLAAAYVSVSQLENPSDKWATIPWLWYCLSMLVGIAGIAILRYAARRDEANDENTEAEYSVVSDSLQNLAETVGRLCGQNELQLSEVVRAIDDECAERFSSFADSRQSIVRRFGLKVYADVMTEFASAERYVNRCWSAAVDGYIDEVTASLQRANRHLEKAMTLMSDAERAAIT